MHVFIIMQMNFVIQYRKIYHNILKMYYSIKINNINIMKIRQNIRH